MSFYTNKNKEPHTKIMSLSDNLSEFEYVNYENIDQNDNYSYRVNETIELRLNAKAGDQSNSTLISFQYFQLENTVVLSPTRNTVLQMIFELEDMIHNNLCNVPSQGKYEEIYLSNRESGEDFSGFPVLDDSWSVDHESMDFNRPVPKTTEMFGDKKVIIQIENHHFELSFQEGQDTSFVLTNLSDYPNFHTCLNYLLNSTQTDEEILNYLKFCNYGNDQCDNAINLNRIRETCEFSINLDGLRESCEYSMD